MIRSTAMTFPDFELYFGSNAESDALLTPFHEKTLHKVLKLVLENE